MLRRSRKGSSAHLGASIVYAYRARHRPRRRIKQRQQRNGGSARWWTASTAEKGNDICVSVVFCFFFFQAEDGIRDSSVTGVQTCALPIYTSELQSHLNFDAPRLAELSLGYRCSSDIPRTARPSAARRNSPHTEHGSGRG